MTTPPQGGPQVTTQSAAPLAPAVRHRLQKVFERAQGCLDKGDHDYAHQLLSQCVTEDPACDIYLKGFLDNLRRKYGNSKKGAKLAGLKIKSLRSTLAKGAEKGDWHAAFSAGCAALALNPWDTTTLLAMAKCCATLRIDECRLIYLRSALDVDAKDPIVNREAALALTQMGQFDQAIACWHRVELAKPHDDEALQAISRLSVEKTIKEGGYDPEMLGGAPPSDDAKRRMTVGGLSRGRAPSDPQEDGTTGGAGEASPSLPMSERLLAAIRSQPAEIGNYLSLADAYLRDGRVDDARIVLDQAHQASGGGDARVRERMQDVQLLLAQRQVEMAQKNYEHEQSPEAQELWEVAKRHAQQLELEIYHARVQYEPQNPRLQWELGTRLKRAGKYKEAVQAFQVARADSKRKALVLLELGECFQKIEQYKLALANYEQAIEVCDDPNDAAHKLALYRAGVLSTGLRELDRAERHLNALAGLDFGYRDVAERLDKLNRLRNSS